MPSAEFWDVWNDEENIMLKKLIHTSYGGTNKEVLGWHEIAKIMNDDDDLGWSNHGRLYNDFIIRYHWRDLMKKEAEKNAVKAQEEAQKET